MRFEDKMNIFEKDDDGRNINERLWDSIRRDEEIEERAYEEAEYLAYVREQEKKKEFQKRYEAEQRKNSYSASPSSKSTNSTACISPTSSKKKESSPNIGFIGWLLFIAIIVLFVDAIVEMLTTGFGKGIFILAIDFIVFLLFGVYTNRRS